MATQTETKTTPTATDPLGLQAAVERFTEAARKAGEDHLELYEQTVGQLADLEVRTAEATGLPFVTTIAETHAAAGRDLASAYVTTVRDLLEA